MREMSTLGAALRHAGLHRRALAAWAGTDRLSALARLVPGLRGRQVTPASALLASFVAGAPLDRAALPVPLVRALDEAGVIDGTYARVALLPLGEALLACDRADAPDDALRACWPDDSSYHLALALPPERRARWLDLGCGSAFAQLWRPELATVRAGSDVNPRALAHARLGAELSGIALELAASDAGASMAGTWDLVTCNAPIPGNDQLPVWQSAGPGLLATVAADARRLVAPGGTIVLHAALDALEPLLAAASGERVTVAYTPPDVVQFGITWWRPDAAPLAISARRELDPGRPHLTHADRIAALRHELPPP
jgi:SAM-dependent methyltransferase